MMSLSGTDLFFHELDGGGQITRSPPVPGFDVKQYWKVAACDETHLRGQIRYIPILPRHQRPTYQVSGRSPEELHPRTGTRVHG
eukprot:3936560-Rhodomonas_salina.2